MKYLLWGSLVIILLASIAFVSYKYGVKTNTTQPSPSAQLVGNDRDEHGCIPSAGYSWCEEKEKCLRPWEEDCTVKETADDNTTIAQTIKKAIVAKHGSSAETLTVTVSKVEGNYASGGAGGEGGGGMWFAAKVNGVWELVWDGNGIILCSDLADYPDYPTSLIPQCFNDQTEEMVTR